MLSIKQFLFLTYASILKLVYNVFFVFYGQSQPTIEKAPDVIKTPYGELYMNRFKNSFDDLINVNSNIDTVFYDKTQLKDALVEADNDLEKKWRTRILIEPTPLCGNVIMYYDAYKLGFAYHSDYYVPYDVLNKLAMKYVITYHCRDFFMDELERPDDKPSKLLNLLEEDKKKEKPKESQSNAQLRSGPFAKLKTYNNTNQPVKKPEPTKDKIRNCFINRGKIANFYLLQKPIIKKEGFTTTMVKGLFENANVQKEVFSYRDFKEARQKLEAQQ